MTMYFVSEYMFYNGGTVTMYFISEYMFYNCGTVTMCFISEYMFNLIVEEKTCCLAHCVHSCVYV